MTIYRSFTGYLNSDLGISGDPLVGQTFDISTAPALNIVIQDDDADTNIAGDTTNEVSTDGNQFVFIENGETSVVDNVEFYLESIFTFTIAGDPTTYTGYNFESNNGGVDFIIFPPGIPAGVGTLQSVNFNPNPNAVDYDALSSGDEIVSENSNSSLNLSGNDTIDAGDGDDRIDAAAGTDNVDAGAGNDVVLGEAGADTIVGGAGNDRILGGDDADSLDGGADNDRIWGDAGNDTIEGGTGDDDIIGGQGADLISGGAGDDTLRGGEDETVSALFNQTGNDGLADAGTIGDFPTTALTFEMTFNADIGSANNTPLGSYAVNGSNNEFLLFVSGGTVRAYINGPSYNTGVQASELFDGTDHTFSISWDSTTGELNSYVDGVLADTGTHQAGNPLTAGGNLVFGQEQDNVGGAFDTNQTFEGEFIEARLWSDIRTPTEIANNAGVPLSAGEGNLVSNWLPAADLSGLEDVAGTHDAPFTGDVTTSTGSVDLSADTLDGGDGNDFILGEGGDDNITVGVGDVADGGADADTFILDFAQTSSDASNIISIDGATDGVDDDTLDLSSRGRFSLSRTTDADGDSESGTATYDSGQIVNFSEIENLIVCFAKGTQIGTRDGTRAVEDLKSGDHVMTRDNGLQTIRWIGKRKLDANLLAAYPKLRPIRISAGALGNDMPSRDLVLSPQHRIVVRSKIAIRMFEAQEVFVAAKHLLGLSGVSVVSDMKEVTYYHILCDNHEIIEADGAFAETLLTGTEAMKSMTLEALEEIALILGDRIPEALPMALMAPRARFSRKLVERHIKNDKAMYA